MNKKMYKLAIPLLVICLILSAVPLMTRATEPTEAELTETFRLAGLAKAAGGTCFEPDTQATDAFVFYYLNVTNAHGGTFQMTYVDYLAAAGQYFTSTGDMIAYLTENGYCNDETGTVTFPEISSSAFIFTLTNHWNTGDTYTLQGLHLDSKFTDNGEVQEGFDYFTDSDGHSRDILACMELTLKHTDSGIKISGYRQISYYYDAANDCYYDCDGGSRLTTRYRKISSDCDGGSQLSITGTKAYPGNTFSWYPDGDQILQFTAAATSGYRVTGVSVIDAAAEHTLELTEDGSYSCAITSGAVTIVVNTETAPEPSTEPTEPSSEATEPSTEPAEPSSEATEPSTEPTEPSSEATEPSTEPTEPSSEATEPSTEPTTEPTQPSSETTDPSTEPTQPSSGETEPTVPPSYPDSKEDTVSGIIISWPPESAATMANLKITVSFPDQATDDAIYQLLTEKLGSNVIHQIFDISLLDSDGSAVQPGTSLLVMLPIPQIWEGQELHVYHVDPATGTVSDMLAAVSDDGKYMCFTVDHFSYYVMALVTPDTDLTPILIWGVILLCVLSVAAVGVVLFMLHRNRNASEVDEPETEAAESDQPETEVPEAGEIEQETEDGVTT